MAGKKFTTDISFRIYERIRGLKKYDTEKKSNRKLKMVSARLLTTRHRTSRVDGRTDATDGQAVIRAHTKAGSYLV